MADEATPDGDTVTDDLDKFSELMFSGKQAEPEAPEDEAETEETSEIETPSATEGNESDAEEALEAEGDDGDDAPADEKDEGDDEEEEETPLLKVKSRKSARERINELTAKARTAERELAELRRQLEERQDVVDKKSETPDARESLGKEAPNPDALLENGDPVYPLGEFDPTYIRDLTRHTIRQESEASKKAAEEERYREQMEHAERELLESWTEKLEASAEKLPDLHEKAADLEDTFVNLDPNYGKFLAGTIMSLEYGPEVLDYLADNIAEARKIVASGPTQATIALGRIEARFALAAEKSNDKEVEKGKIVKPTAAPTPPPRNKGAVSSQSVAADTDDLDAFEKKFYAKK